MGAALVPPAFGKQTNARSSFVAVGTLAPEKLLFLNVPRRRHVGTLAAKSFAISTNGSNRSESSCWRDTAGQTAGRLTLQVGSTLTPGASSGASFTMLPLAL